MFDTLKLPGILSKINGSPNRCGKKKHIMWIILVQDMEFVSKFHYYLHFHEIAECIISALMCVRICC